MKLTKSIITRDEAFRLAPDFVRYTEGEHHLFERVNKKEESITMITERLTGR